MSYPPQPPNNPYGGRRYPPPQQGYGYPPQPPGGQPGYGFQQPVQGGYPQQPGFNYPNAPETMPGTVNTVRVIMLVFAGLGILAAIGVFVRAAAFNQLSGGFAGIGTGVLMGFAVFWLLVNVGAIYLASQFGNARSSVRIWSILYGVLLVLVGLLTLIGVVGMVPLALGILIIVFLAKQEGSQWFTRGRY
ncbi:hypothetical protein [Streptomyces winkii]|uniref:hypothetical protein n=1 Tax=Streptomyces winkii TaxID=3051178 RepID=UPI0028D3F4D4|nr:hypothetical protein [Streptomyces sp. DSM 40971]